MHGLSRKERHFYTLFSLNHIYFDYPREKFISQGLEEKNQSKSYYG